MVRNGNSSSADSKPAVVLTLPGTLRGARRLLPVSLFVIPFGIAFGVAAGEQGLSPAQTIAMSLLVFSGVAQFAALEFWRDPIAYLSLTLVVLAVNGRLVIMGAALSPWLNRLPPARRLFVLGFLSDPNFADSQPALQKGERDLGILFGGGLIIWLIWVAGTAVGALGGKAIGNLEAFGFDVVMACFFAAIVAGQLRGAARIAPVVVACAVAVLTLDLLPTGWNVILAALAGGLTSLVRDAK